MRITESAVKAILDVMNKKGLNPKKIHLEIGVFEGGLGLGFTNEGIGQRQHFGDLSVVISHSVDTEGVVMDFGEVDGRKGLIFLGEEQYVNHSN